MRAGGNKTAPLFLMQKRVRAARMRRSKIVREFFTPRFIGGASQRPIMRTRMMRSFLTIQDHLLGLNSWIAGYIPVYEEENNKNTL